MAKIRVEMECQGFGGVIDHGHLILEVTGIPTDDLGDLGEMLAFMLDLQCPCGSTMYFTVALDGYDDLYDAEASVKIVGGEGDALDMNPIGVLRIPEWMQLQ